MERDGWIMVAAQVPQQIDAIIANKHIQLDDPDMLKLYRLISESVSWPVDEPRLVEIADIMERLLIRAVRRGGYRRPRRLVRRPAGRDCDQFVTARRAAAGDPAGAGLEGLDPDRATACRRTQRLAAIHRAHVDWALPDPKAAEVDELRATSDEVKRPVDALVSEPEQHRSHDAASASILPQLRGSM